MPPPGSPRAAPGPGATAAPHAPWASLWAAPAPSAYEPMCKLINEHIVTDGLSSFVVYFWLKLRAFLATAKPFCFSYDLALVALMMRVVTLVALLCMARCGAETVTQHVKAEGDIFNRQQRYADLSSSKVYTNRIDHRRRDDTTSATSPQKSAKNPREIYPFAHPCFCLCFGCMYV